MRTVRGYMYDLYVRGIISAKRYMELSDSTGANLVYVKWVVK
jgi:hypothetical protein